VLWSRTTEYALRAVVCLAEQDDQSLTTAEIAKTTRVPHEYLSKVLRMLAHAGLVRPRRGLGGGFVLVRSPSNMTILDVVGAVDPMRRIEECPLGRAAHGQQLCELHSRVDEAIAMVEQLFASARLSDLLGPGDAAALCRPVPVRLHKAARRGQRSS